MAQDITISMHQRYGRGRIYVARITGSDEHYGLAREFIRGSRASTSRSGRTWDTEWTIATPGLYEVSDGASRDCRIVYLRAGELSWRAIDDARRDDMVARMTAGASYDAARRATMPPPAAPATVDVVRA